MRFKQERWQFSSSIYPAIFDHRYAIVSWQAENVSVQTKPACPPHIQNSIMTSFLWKRTKYHLLTLTLGIGHKQTTILNIWMNYISDSRNQYYMYNTCISSYFRILSLDLFTWISFIAKFWSVLLWRIFQTDKQ
jgi:hypothetical protein